ncbi:MAG TPA: SagB family peptide dehydrogenase [Chloroflexota bacterium]
MAHSGEAAWRYHDATKHSLASLRATTHRLDWPNQPLPFKIYTDLAPLPLPHDFSAWSAQRVDKVSLARLCFYANGVTRKLRRHDEQVPFRAAACTGALYHIELYVVCQDLPDLAAGVYHYGAHDHALRQLRPGDVRAALIDATGGESHVAHAPAIVVLTSTFWRNAWKYQARAYRHSFWDSGTILANALAVDPTASVVMGFADDAVNQLLGIDAVHEAAICLMPIGLEAASPIAAPALPPLDHAVQPLSRSEVDYPAITAMHNASSLPTGTAAAHWRSDIAPAPAAWTVPGPPIEEVIIRRGSARRFNHAPITRDQLEIILATATAPVAADWGERLTTPYLIVHAVDGLEPGSYVFEGSLKPLQQGDFRAVAGFLDLGQELAADAAVNVYSLADLHTVLDRLDNRGYRAAQLEGAIEGGRLYLGAYALGLGATGLTFFDDDVIRFFSPHAADKSVMFLTAIGHPARRASFSSP